jgi:hypothetical protein
MAVEHAIEALQEHWDDVVSQLTSDESRELRTLIGRLGGPDHEQVVARIVDLLVEGLPPRHAVRRALAKGDLFAPAATDWPVITSALQDRAAVIPSPAADPGDEDPGDEDPGDDDPGDEEPPTAAEILRTVTGRLLAAPALTEEEVREHGADPGDPSLIRLERPDGGRQWPIFQFTAGNGPLPVVRTINNLLGAAADPLGVADWWLSRNGWLDGKPSLLLGRVSDDRLVSAARAVGSDA